MINTYTIIADVKVFNTSTLKEKTFLKGTQVKGYPISSESGAVIAVNSDGFLIPITNCQIVTVSNGAKLAVGLIIVGLLGALAYFIFRKK
jgi:hypothetical protein